MSAVTTAKAMLSAIRLRQPVLTLSILFFLDVGSSSMVPAVHAGGLLLAKIRAPPSPQPARLAAGRCGAGGK